MMRHKQQGVMLLEALIAILIFSMGILAIVGLQASAIKVSGDAKYRADASLLANELIGQMWVSDRTSSSLQAKFQGSEFDQAAAPTPYGKWVEQVNNALPGVSENPPIVTVQPVTGPVTSSGSVTNSSIVTITVRWKSPSDTAPHNYVVSVQINSLTSV